MMIASLRSLYSNSQKLQVTAEGVRDAARVSRKNGYMPEYRVKDNNLMVKRELEHSFCALCTKLASLTFVGKIWRSIQNKAGVYLYNLSLWVGTVFVELHVQSQSVTFHALPPPPA